MSLERQLLLPSQWIPFVVWRMSLFLGRVLGLVVFQWAQAGKQSFQCLHRHLPPALVQALGLPLGFQ